LRPRKTSSTPTIPRSSNIGSKIVAAGWIGFLFENVVLSENREWLCTEYGEENYHLGYNTLSSAACLSILYGYAKHKGTGRTWFKKSLLGKAPMPLKVGAIVLQSFGLACFAQLAPALQIPVALENSPVGQNNSNNNNSNSSNSSNSNSNSNSNNNHSNTNNGLGPSRRPESNETTTAITFKARCPMDFRAKPELPPDAVYGIERITRHSNLWALASLGVGTALTTPFVVNSLFFGGPLLLATLGTAHQDSRYRRGLGGSLSTEKENRTSNIPFAALLVGRQDWMKLFEEIKWLNGGVATLLVVLAHVR
jgi:hypothetical protein